MVAKTALPAALALGLLLLFHLGKSQECSEFTIPPQSVLVSAGQTALMECEYGTRAVRWRKGSTSILDMEDGSNPCDCQILSDGDLQFNNASLLGDAGEYTCFVLVAHGVQSMCTATLGVRLAEAPDFSNKMGPGSADSTSRELSVHVAGDPPPAVVWRHNGNDIANSRVTISSEEDGNGNLERLTITGILPEDRGRYTLHASNTAGEASVGWDVFVLFGTVDIVSANDEETVLTCSGEFYPMGNTSWVRGGQEVAGQDTLIIMGTYETTFQTSLAVPESSCGADPEIVRCQLRHNAVEGKVTRSQGYVVCRATDSSLEVPSSSPSFIDISYSSITTDSSLEVPSSSPSFDKEERTSSKCSPSFAEGVGVGIAVGIVTTSFAAVAVTVIIKKCRQTRDQKKVTLTRNMAYEVPSQLKVKLTKNMAYEVPPPTISSGRMEIRNALYEECT